MIMDDFNEDDFDSLPIKPRGKKATSPRQSPNPSPNNNKSPKVKSPDLFSSSQPLLSEGNKDSKNDSDYEVTFKTNLENHEDGKDNGPKMSDNEEQDIVIPRNGPNISNYQLNFDDMDFDTDARDSGFVRGSSDIDDSSNHNDIQGTVKDDSIELGGLSLNDETSTEAHKENTNVDVNVKQANEGDPVKRKGVTFQMDANETFSKPKFNEDSTLEDPFATSGMTCDDDFSALNKSEFIDNLDYLEKCGESDIERRERQAALARQSLYQRFDPLVKDGTPVKTDRKRGAGLAALKEKADQLLQSKTPLNGIQELSQLSSPVAKSSVSTEDDQPNVSLTRETAMSPRAAGVGLVDPLLYTEKDMIAREMKWKKQVQQLEALRNEEIAMRELVEQDAKEKQDSLRSEIEELRKAVVEYERTIIQLSETTQEDTLLKQDRVSELLKEKEQLQLELNAADSSTYDAYKRMEKMKSSIDSLKQNEATLNRCISDYQQKLKESEERYQNLRKQAEARVEKANIEIELVKKSKEVDLAGLQAALKQLQAKNSGIELQLNQKISENEELTKILDDLISRVTPDS